MSEEVYGELFALGQFMPGPTSTQVSFAIGIVKKGVTGIRHLQHNGIHQLFKLQYTLDIVGIFALSQHRVPLEICQCLRV